VPQRNFFRQHCKNEQRVNESIDLILQLNLLTFVGTIKKAKNEYRFWLFLFL